MMRRLAVLAFALGCAACTVGPDYQRASAPMPATYKELKGGELKGWQLATPQDAVDRGPWWSIYHDPLLDWLERQVNVSNQAIKEFEAEYRNAVALTAEARAGLFPTVGVNAGVTRLGANGSASGSGLGSSGIGSKHGSTTGSLEGTVDWTLDVWGRIRREVESQAAGAQLSAADIANARLSAQATLAIDYFDLRAEDSLQALLQQTEAAFRRALQITVNQYNAGTISRGDVVTAQAQLQAVVAQLAGVGVLRAQFEHAIAMLIGRPPAELSIPFSPLPRDVPVIPPSLPATLLQRRPDIAAAERAMQQENAQIGVAVAAYYPTISLSALGGFVGNPFGQFLGAADRIWSLGAAASEPIFEGGARTAAVSAARATYDQSVATYRQTVLSAFQQVEDELAAQRILAQQAVGQAAAVADAQRAVDVTLNEYRAGTVAYTSVITEQEQLLTVQQAALTVLQNRFVASATLIEALGGGWTAAQLPPLSRIEHVPIGG